MVKLIETNILSFTLFFILLVNFSYSSPVSKSKQTISTDSVNVESQSHGRTIMTAASNMMKDMFDWGSVTWVPLGSLIFGKTDESLGFAKWPNSKNNNNNNNGK